MQSNQNKDPQAQVRSIAVVGVLAGGMSILFGLFLTLSSDIFSGGGVAPPDSSGWSRTTGTIVDFTKLDRPYDGSRIGRVGAYERLIYFFDPSKTKYLLTYSYRVPPDPRLSKFLNTTPREGLWVRLSNWWENEYGTNANDGQKYPVGTKVTVYYNPKSVQTEDEP
jgi:hypothetical protein